MGGSSRSTTATAWAGHAELKEALDALATAKGVSANRVKAVANAACKHAKDYKRVVHDVEVFLWKAEAEHRLAGLYAMDAIMRQSQAKLGAKDAFVKRFLQHMNNTIAAVKRVPIEQQGSVAHVIEEWQSRGYYTPDEIEEAGGHEYSLKNRAPSRPVTSEAEKTGPSPSPSHADSASKSKIVSLLSKLKQQKELFSQQGTAPIESPARPQESKSRDSPRVLDGRREHSSDRDRDRDRRRDRSRSRSRSRGRGRDSGRNDRRSPDRFSRDQDSSRRSFEDDPRDSKKPRSSRWGPPRPAESDSARDHNRPHAIDTFGNRDVDRSTRFESHSPRSRFNGAPGDGPPGPLAPPYGYQGPPPPFRSGPPPPLQTFSNGPPPPSVQFPPPGPAGQHSGPPGGSGNTGAGGNHPSGSSATAGGGPSTGDQPREICRKFIAGRCTFGDRCWHIHDQSGGDGPRTGGMPPRTELNHTRRKTVLCANFPLGTCRYGDRCSFAHGEDDLDPSVRGRRPPPRTSSPLHPHQQPSPHGSGPPQPWAASPHSHSAPPSNGYDRPPVTGASQFIPPYGQPPGQNEPNAVPAYNYQQAYGSRPPASSQPQSAPGVSASVSQWAGAAAANGYGGGAGYGNPPGSHASATAAASDSRARERAPSRDEDEAAAAPEFNLQYDDED